MNKVITCLPINGKQVLFLLCFLSYGQFKYTGNIFIKSKKLFNEYDDLNLMCKYNASKYYFLSRTKIKGKIQLFVYESNVRKLINIKLPVTWDELNGNNFLMDFSIDVENNILSMVFIDYLILINLHNNSLIKKIKINLSNIYYTGNNFFLASRLYNFHPDDEKNKFVIFKIDSKNGQILDSAVINYGHDIPYTILVHKFFDVCNSNIVFTKSTYPHIYFVNHHLRVYDSIKVLEELFINNIHFENENDYTLLNQSSKDVYFKMKKMDSVNYRIEKIFYVTPSHLVISVKPPGTTFTVREIFLIKKAGNEYTISKICNHKAPDVYNEYDFLNFTYHPDFLFFENNRIHKIGRPFVEKYRNQPLEEVMDKIYDKKYKGICIYYYTVDLQ
jgi:hypothetical protein